MKRTSLALLVAAAACTALPAAAQFQKPEDAINYRQSAMTLMGAHFGRVAAMASGKAPFDAKTAAANAALAQTLSALPFAAFGPGTEKGAPTRANAEIWTDADKFRKLAEDMQTAMAKVDVAAKAGDLDQIKSAVGDTGKVCKACHDDFRDEKYSN